MVWLTVHGRRKRVCQRAIGVRKGLLGEVGEGMDFGGDEQQTGRSPPHVSGLAESGNKEEGEEY